ncbi:hypothetical protein E4U39_006022 [Claviceps sp. Clav50 group G5]|nr:hypothetical protein E4U39_006022 [Claviceps sp. Clav50 group G5]
MDQNWEKSNFTRNDLYSKVDYIHICARENETNIGYNNSPPVNSWFIFLEISALHSVRLLMSQNWGAQNLRGRLEIATKDYAFTHNAIHQLSFRTIGGPKVKDIVDMIKAKSLQKYEFTPDWEGCRFWVYIFICHLKREGFIESGSVGKAELAISYYYIYPSGRRVLRKAKEGTFRSPAKSLLTDAILNE